MSCAMVVKDALPNDIVYTFDTFEQRLIQLL